MGRGAALVGAVLSFQICLLTAGLFTSEGWADQEGDCASDRAKFCIKFHRSSGEIPGPP